MDTIHFCECLASLLNFNLNKSIKNSLTNGVCQNGVSLLTEKLKSANKYKKHNIIIENLKNNHF